MKKFFLISAMLLIGALSVNAQTYLYKYLYSVDENGVKSQKMNPHKKYYTFSNNSDKDGNLIKIGTPLHVKASTETRTFEYIGKENNIFKYKLKDYIEYTWGGITNKVEGNQWLLFSLDFSRMNHKWLSTGVEVYERVTEPEKEQSPTQLY